LATYKVQSNGKAPSGLKKGDTVVTGGGTYKITGTNADGSYTSTKVNNTTTSNYTGSYAPAPSSGGGGGSSGGSGGGGGSSSNYSPYTKPTLGDTWDANTDYQAIINNAVGAGDYVTAAKAEQLRNQKIISTGSNYATSNNYSGWLDSTDYGTIGKTQMSNGASWQDVLDTYNSRYNKANGTVGLEQYANDELQNMMLRYINDKQALEEYQNMIREWEQDNPKEEYESQYDPQIDALLNEILNREDFSYDVTSDPLYQQYAQMYQREGDRAMRETLAEAAASAGGMNSYAITAASQANNYYNSQLNDKIPELYQLAYNMYINDKESKVQDLGILQNMDATQYGRYRDTINDWYNDKQFAYGVYQDAVQQGNWQTTYDNNNYWANKEFDNSNFWKDKEFNANQAEIDYNKTTAEQEKAESRLWEFIDRGVMPSDEIITQAGWNKADVERLVAAAQAEKAKTGSPSKGKDIDDDDLIDDDDTPVGGGDNYTHIANACQELADKGDVLGAAAYAKAALDAGHISQAQYSDLLAKYNPMLGWMTAGSQTNGANK
jgi:hypothetical protein